MERDVLRTGLVVICVLLLAACGGSSGLHRARQPKLPHALAQQWAGEADGIAAAAQAGDGCQAQQLARTLEEQVAQDTARIPARLRTPLSASVTSLVGRIACVRIEKPTPPPKHGPPPKKKHGDHGPPHGPGDHGGGK